MTEINEIVDLKKTLRGARVEIMALEGQLSEKSITGTIEGMMNELAEVWIRVRGSIVYPVVIVVNLDSPFIDRNYGDEEGGPATRLYLYVYNVEQLAMLVKEGWTNESAIVAYRQRDEGDSSCEPQSRGDLLGVAKDVDLKLISLAD